jgi:NitT/TauT family transport system substrate-binding protein
MKKNWFIYVLIIIICCISIIIIKSKEDNKNNLTTVNVAEVTHSAFYTPFYVAIANGYFEDNGLNVKLTLTSGANNVIAAVLSGDTEIGLCGPEATIYVYNEGEKDYIKSFAGLTKRDGQFIVSRTKIDNFTLKDLEGKEVLGGRAGGMPIINFYNALKKANVSNVKVNDSVDFANLTSAFISGTGDFVNLFEPNATKLEKLGYGYVVASVGQYSSEVPYTAFNAKKSYISKNKETIEKFRDALNKGLNYTLNNDSNVIAKDILNLFPDTSLNDLEIIIERYKKADSWLNNTTINEKLFNNLEDIMIDNNLIKKYVPYNNLIIND